MGQSRSLLRSRFVHTRSDCNSSSAWPQLVYRPDPTATPLLHDKLRGSSQVTSRHHLSYRRVPHTQQALQVHLLPRQWSLTHPDFTMRMLWFIPLHLTRTALLLLVFDQHMLHFLSSSAHLTENASLDWWLSPSRMHSPISAQVYTSSSLHRMIPQKLIS